MHAAVVHKLGEPPRCEQFSEPVASDNEVIVHVHAASIKPVDKQIASGSHYASPRELPFVCGIDGVGHLSDGQRVFFGGCRPPYGAMAQRTVVPKAFTFPLPHAYRRTCCCHPEPQCVGLACSYVPREIGCWRKRPHLGCDRVTGRLAIKIAKLLGARRVVAAGRNQQGLQSLAQLGADATVRLDLPEKELQQAFVRESW